MRRQFGLVFQQFDLFPHYTVLKNVCDAPISVQKRDRAEVEAEAMALLDKMGLKGKENAYPYQLSGGQKKRVALAAVVSMNPDILVLDEPTNGLDEDSCDIVVNFLLAYVAAGKTVLMSTHHQDLVRRLGARAIYIDRYHHVVEAPSPSYGTESGATDWLLRRACVAARAALP